MKTRVKICGIRQLDSAQTAIEAGADFLGCNFVNSSKRFINPMRAKTIIDKIGKKIPIIGVFQNATIDEVNEHIRYLKLPFVQLHGNEDNTYIKKIKAEVIKVFHISYNMEDILRFLQNDNGNYILLDREQQGKGDMIDIKKSKIIAEKYPTFLAGGLTPENVADIVVKTQPYAVDVAGGIETNGIEDLEKIRMFITNAKFKS